MTTWPASVPQLGSRFSSDEERWNAIVNRDPSADGLFVFSVRTTGVYCRSVCPARLPLRKNVRFHATCQAAEAAGFRPCKRCKPNDASLEQRRTAMVIQACRVIEESEESPGLDELARSAGLSRHHFHRLFKAKTGITPKAYAAAHRQRRVMHELEHSDTVTSAIYRVGYNSSSRFYENSNATLGMTPQAFRTGGPGVSIRFAIGDCSLGAILVAATAKGICAISLGDQPDELARDLQDRFPHAELIGGDATFERWIAQVVGFVENPDVGLDLPLDVRGTAFQRRVWEALREIPCGSTVSYHELARQMGRAKSYRAVAGACAANLIAVAIPCHRVVRTDGSLSGYRWGVERKKELLRRERETQ